MIVNTSVIVSAAGSEAKRMVIELLTQSLQNLLYIACSGETRTVGSQGKVRRVVVSIRKEMVNA